jgi:2-oxo-4-hydroxy-4-carboxy-5-ureidoimidazoline decarboxylase
MTGVYEDSPWVAQRAFEDLCAVMRQTVEAATREEQLALLRAHPDLGTRARISPDSTSEQAGVGLDRLTPDEYDLLTRLNDTYRQKFGFPFIYAVKGSNKQQIIAALQMRCENTPEAEFREALDQVHRIARFRMENLCSNSPVDPSGVTTEKAT